MEVNKKSKSTIKKSWQVSLWGSYKNTYVIDLAFCDTVIQSSLRKTL